MKAPATKESLTVEQMRQLTIAEVMSLLGYSRGTVDKLINAGELQSVKNGKMRRVPVWAIEDWQRKNSSGVE